jgi:hypothetical protein
MATVTGMTAAAMIAIRDGSVIDAEINGSGHLILTKYDESEIDAGSITDAVALASLTVAGLVELATTGETTTGTDATRAVTPAGLSAVSSTKQPLDDDLTAIASIAPTNNDIIQRKSGAWINRTMAQLLVDILALPLAGGTLTGSLALTTGDVSISTAGRGLKIAEGSNAKMGRATLNGTTGVVVNTTAVGTNSEIFMTTQVPGGTLGVPVVVSRVNATSFTIRSSVAGDVSTVAWMIVDPA